MIIKGEADILLYYKAQNHKWDSCAGEAIILALGGFFTESSSIKGIRYDGDDPKERKSNYVNFDGNICSFNPELLDCWYKTVI